MLTSEIQQRLLLDGVLLPDEIPSVTAINTSMCEKLLFTKKKISSTLRIQHPTKYGRHK